ncbi:MAG: ECF transporter S component [Clostridia bacterium]|nr:ECF transporter S component [Clostridia bacterium]
MPKKSVHKITTSALLLCLGLVLPLLTAQVKEIGDTLLPMHFPVLLCSCICGWQYGLSVGFILPFLRSFIFGMPPIYPNAVWMAFELAAYGFAFGFIYSKFKVQKTHHIYISLISAMLFGRVVWGIAKAILLGLKDKPFGISAFIAGGFLDALPGIVLQIIIIPVIILFLSKSKIVNK